MLPEAPGAREALVFLGWRPTAGFGDVFLLHSFHVEFLGAGDDLVQGFVVVERRGFRKAREVHPRHHERFQIRAGQSLGLQFLDRRADRVIELQDFLAAALTFLQRLCDRFVQEFVDPPQN